MLKNKELWTQRHDFLEAQGLLIISSFKHWTGRDLPGEPKNAKELFESSISILSGGPEADQILNYGNLTALTLWEMDWEKFTSTPSRLTAEPDQRPAREAFLKRVREQGYVDDYSGIRISANGRRFRIKRAVVWNLIDAAGRHAGQAAAFKDWEFIERKEEL